MHAEIIAIGDELTSGQRLDTNTQWLSQRLGEIGIRTLFHTTVADDLSANMEAFQQAARRADVVIATGGLGPTADDLTRQSISSAFDLVLELDADSLRRIQTMFASRGREMPEQNRVQALFPAGSRPILNPHGTAPGIHLVRDTAQHKAHIFALPGVPAEMKEMWDQTVRPTLLRELGSESRVVHHYQIKCFGVGESALEAMLPDLIKRGREPSVGITVSKATITLRVTASGLHTDACREAMEPTIATIRQCLGDLIFGEEDDELQHVVVRLLRARRSRLVLCESGTEGLVANWLHSVPGSLDVFGGGLVTADRVAAKQLLGIDAQLPEVEHTRAAAEAIRARLDADFGIAIGPTPPSTEDPHASIQVAIATPRHCESKAFGCAGHPDILKPRAGKQALDYLRKLYLLQR